MMMSNICLSASGGDPTLGMIVVYGIIGQILIFLVLAVLIGIIYLVRLVFLMIVGKKEDAAKPVETAAPAPQPQSPSVAESAASDEEIAAAIGAVMSVYYGSAAVTGKCAPFKVKKIYKINR